MEGGLINPLALIRTGAAKGVTSEYPRCCGAGRGAIALKQFFDAHVVAVDQPLARGGVG